MPIDVRNIMKRINLERGENYVYVGNMAIYSYGNYLDYANIKYNKNTQIKLRRR